ncbi:hypothetical protein [Cohnella kolymensis]|uniref:hypothetical protein n=1 Tax=Cohnella kolymensis TaxID=1590652 RepID=UPI00190FB35B|nr:hypothetical protein [Cohnella kolymensis]
MKTEYTVAYLFGGIGGGASDLRGLVPSTWESWRNSDPCAALMPIRSFAGITK